ncbi:MAG TPA: VWA domain-containing protein [Steroidobacteraceae bacterium]|nr:VWA domain-containing protein [Steroidobacteraceae bacterium]
MLPEPTSQRPPAGKLADNVVHFARVLRKAGLPVGTDRALLALQALELAGVRGRSELHDVLEACLTSRVEHRPLFDQAFHVFWRDPHLLGEIMRMAPPATGPRGDARQPTASQRLLDALLGSGCSAPTSIQPLGRPESERSEPHIQPSWSDRERLRTMDFESMTSAESLAAQRVIAALEPLLGRLRTRRHSPSRTGVRLELRQLLRDCGRRGGEIAELARSRRRTRLQPLCVIVDISGSMSRYSRMFLHFTHALMSGPRAADLRVSAFVFGTRLTHITRLLRRCDPDEALGRVARIVADWSGGTRIAHCLEEFNRRWARRVPLAGSTVLLVTDGLELADIEALSEQAQRLSRSCRRLLWLNPLLRYDAFAPKARGVKALLPHVDEMLPVHNIESLERLVVALERSSRENASWT